MGIFDFAVATLEEGILLRKNNIRGNILILGYMAIENVRYVVGHHLVQPIVDVEYAKKLNALSFDKKIKVHIKVNTGMNGIGISYKDITSMKQIYPEFSFAVLGIFLIFV